MYKKIIEQIEGIAGVKTVEKCEDRVVVTFESQLTSVHVTNLEQLDFMWLKYFGSKHGSLIGDNMCVYAHSQGDDSGFNEKSAAEQNSTVIPFTQYLKDYDLQEEYLKYMVKEAVKRGLYCDVKYTLRDSSELVVVEPMKLSRDGSLLCANGWNITLPSGEWAEPIKEKEIVLVEGEIYYSHEDGLRWVFRFKGLLKKHQATYYSIIDHEKVLKVDGWLAHRDSSRTCIEATTKQKKKLIKAEVKHGFYWELEKK